MPLTAKGHEILSNMEKTYPSEKKAKQVFYASKNAGKISGVDAKHDGTWGIAQHIDRLGEALGVLEGRMDAIEAAENPETNETLPHLKNRRGKL